MKTEIVFILDRSGSMAGLEKDTIGGYNAMLKKQKQLAQHATVTTVLFDDEYKLLHDRIHINGVAPITEKEYEVRGATALLDAIGKSIIKMEQVQNATLLEERAEKVLFVITTDGEENASVEFTYAKIKKLIERQKERGWEFIFLGANIDAIGEASKLGIEAERAVQYHADSEGTQVNFATLSEAIVEFRQTGKIKSKWKEKLEHDFSSR